MTKKKALFIALFPVSVLLTYGASLFPEIVERYYSTLIYPPIAKIIGNITGIVPFSFAEILVVATLLWLLYKGIKVVQTLVKSPGRRIHILGNKMINLMVVVSILYFSFMVLWGLNYHRQSFAVIANLETRPSSVDALERLSAHLIEQANYLRGYVVEDEGVMAVPGGPRDIIKRADKGYQVAATIYPELAGSYGLPKRVLLSRLMSYQGIAGVYFPFTAEANVNVLQPHFLVPFTVLHEMAHQRGFAREDEANFIAYITATMHPDYDFQYSGVWTGLSYAMNALHRYDVERFNRLREGYSEGVNRDFDAYRRYYHAHEGVIRTVSTRVNNTYLQVNAQRDGVQSYGRMVDLMIAYYNMGEPLPLCADLR